MSAVDLVAQIIAESYDGCAVTRLVLVAEIIDHDGERAVCTETQDDATRWDHLRPARRGATDREGAPDRRGRRRVRGR